MQLRKQREEIVGACRRLAAGGLVVGTAGNVSAREGDLVAVTPTGAVLAEVAPEEMSIVDLGGAVVEGPEPTSEVALHLGVYERHGAGAVVHTHAPTATALSCVLDELPCVHYGMLALGGTVRVAPYATFGTEELAASVLDALEGRTAALMANHGTVALGADVAGAVEATELLEWASRVYVTARQVGEPRTLDEDERAAVVAAVVERGYGRR